MTLEDQRLDYLRKQLEGHGLLCEQKMSGDPNHCRFVVSHDPEVEEIIGKGLVATSPWLFTQRADEVVCASTDARRNSRWGTLTMRFLDVVWHPKLDSH